MKRINVQNPGARYKASTKAVVRITLKNGRSSENHPSSLEDGRVVTDEGEAKAQGEGFSFQDYFSGIYQYGHTLTNNLDVNFRSSKSHRARSDGRVATEDGEANYRTGGLDITASLWAGRYGHAKSLQEHELTYFVGPDYIQSNNSQESTCVAAISSIPTRPMPSSSVIEN